MTIARDNDIDLGPTPLPTGALPAGLPDSTSVRRLVNARHGPWNPWTVLAIAIASVAAAPLLSIAWIALTPADDIWSHLISTVLPGYIRNSLILMLGVGALTASLGVATAWLVTMCALPGRRALSWALVLPLAMPAYLVAYAAVDVLEYAGPVQALVRDILGVTSARDYWFPEIRSLPGAILVMSLTLYPYVYLTARTAFVEQSVCVLEASRTLGRGTFGAFWSVGLPLAWPSIAVGASLAMMEALNDLGTVEHFGVQTLTRGIFDVWLSMGSAAGAAQIAIVMLIVVIGLLTVERLARGRRRFNHLSRVHRPLPLIPLGRVGTAIALAVCVLPIVLGFLLPAMVLAGHAVAGIGSRDLGDLAQAASNSALVAAAAATVTVIAAVLMTVAARYAPQRLTRYAAQVSTIGYAIPGAVLAVGLVIPLAAFDNALDTMLRDAAGISTGLLLTGGIFALVLAYAVRFMMPAFGTVDAALGRVSPSMDMAARALGRGDQGLLRDVHLPLMRGSIFAAAILVFVDVMKELPATLLMRPFNFETLATTAYTYASLEQLDEAAPAALLIVLVGILPVIILSRQMAKSRPGGAPGR